MGSGEHDTALVTYGRLSGECVQAAKGKKSDVIILNQLKPLPETLIETLLSYKKLYFIEESPENGGISQEILATLCKVGYNGAVHTKNVAEGFIPHAPLDYTLNQFGLTAGQIADLLEEDEVSDNG
jgi:deoxyxylulose-5-phosphate synthase